MELWQHALVVRLPLDDVSSERWTISCDVVHLMDCVQGVPGWETEAAQLASFEARAVDPNCRSIFAPRPPHQNK